MELDTMESFKITIAIDGFSSCGKSTLAKALAEELGYIFIDSGAMYRGITLFAMQNDLIIDGLIDEEELYHRLDDISLQFELNTSTKRPELLLNGTNVESLIRTLEVSNNVSPIAALKPVRDKLVSQQRILGLEGGVVMDGRDIGSVVFPNAELKLFVTADPEIRAERRYNELLGKGQEITIQEVRENLSSRDLIDTTRKESPLVQADDAIVLDNSNLSPQDQLEKALELVEMVISGRLVE